MCLLAVQLLHVPSLLCNRQWNTRGSLLFYIPVQPVWCYAAVLPCLQAPRELGLKLRPVASTLTGMAQSLIDVGVVKPQAKAQ